LFCACTSDATTSRHNREIVPDCKPDCGTGADGKPQKETFGKSSDCNGLRQAATIQFELGRLDRGVAVACTIISNNIESPDQRDAVSGAIREGIGEKPGEWEVIVYQAQDYAGFAIRISGPGNLRWNWTFFGKEQAPDFIRERVAQCIAAQQSLESLREDYEEDTPENPQRDEDETSE
jgi:hypothetical protein